MSMDLLVAYLLILGSGELEAGWPLKTWYQDFEAVCHIRIGLTKFVLMNKRTSILRNRSNNTNGVWNRILRALRPYQLKSGWTTDFRARTVISEWKTCKQKDKKWFDGAESNSGNKRPPGGSKTSNRSEKVPLSSEKSLSQIRTSTSPVWSSDRLKWVQKFGWTSQLAGA